MAAAAVDLAGRWLARPRATDHEKLLRLTRMLLDALTDEPSPITAVAWETVGGLEGRLGDAASAAEAFGRAASIWAQFDVRQREDALVSAAFAHLLAGDDAEAAAALDTAGAKSLLVSAQGVLTAMTPRICNGKAAFALRRGDLEDAATHVQAAFAGEHEAICRDHGPEVLAEVNTSDRTGGSVDADAPASGTAVFPPRRPRRRGHRGRAPAPGTRGLRRGDLPASALRGLSLPRLRHPDRHDEQPSRGGTGLN